MILRRLALRAFFACAMLATTPSCADQIGRASFYGHESGMHRADGRPFIPSQLGAAHWTLPLGTRVRITNLATGRIVALPINDRGPHPRLHRLFDLSLGAARALGITQRGLTTVHVTVLG